MSKPRHISESIKDVKRQGHKDDCDCGKVGVRWSPDFPFHFRIRIGDVELDIEHELGDALADGMARCYCEAEAPMEQA